ncbi:hypothetical protein NUW54_g494 [Trametes sanguinea]|uniref:Uncharacterized protein n=1 Tax=Trametes sanguinea TaxID=158606 RepID=A0ACC1Q9L7_9APHY|nr:hypothetical protein NUW54_g494 [Trametes sanguinea]
MSSQQDSAYAIVDSQIQAIRSLHLLLELELRTFLEEHSMPPARPEQWTKQLVSSLLSLNSDYLVQISQKVENQARKYRTSAAVVDFEAKLAAVHRFIEEKGGELPAVEHRLECARDIWSPYHQKFVEELLDTTRQCHSAQVSRTLALVQPYKTSESIWANVAPAIDRLRSLSSQRNDILRRALIIDQHAALHWDGEVEPPPDEVHGFVETLKSLRLEIKGQAQSQNIALTKLHAETVAAGSRPDAVSDGCGEMVNLMDLADAVTQYASLTRFLDLLDEMKDQIDDAMKKMALKLATATATFESLSAANLDVNGSLGTADPPFEDVQWICLGEARCKTAAKLIQSSPLIPKLSSSSNLISKHGPYAQSVDEMPAANELAHLPVRPATRSSRGRHAQVQILLCVAHEVQDEHASPVARDIDVGAVMPDEDSSMSEGPYSADEAAERHRGEHGSFSRNVHGHSGNGATQGDWQAHPHHDEVPRYQVPMGFPVRVTPEGFLNHHRSAANYAQQSSIPVMLPPPPPPLPPLPAFSPHLAFGYPPGPNVPPTAYGPQNGMFSLPPSVLGYPRPPPMASFPFPNIHPFLLPKVSPHTQFNVPFQGPPAPPQFNMPTQGIPSTPNSHPLHFPPLLQAHGGFASASMLASSTAQLGPPPASGQSEPFNPDMPDIQTAEVNSRPEACPDGEIDSPIPTPPPILGKRARSLDSDAGHDSTISSPRRPQRKRTHLSASNEAVGTTSLSAPSGDTTAPLARSRNSAVETALDTESGHGELGDYSLPLRSCSPVLGEGEDAGELVKPSPEASLINALPSSNAAREDAVYLSGRNNEAPKEPERERYELQDKNSLTTTRPCSSQSHAPSSTAQAEGDVVVESDSTCHDFDDILHARSPCRSPSQMPHHHLEELPYIRAADGEEHEVEQGELSTAHGTKVTLRVAPSGTLPIVANSPSHPLDTISSVKRSSVDQARGPRLCPEETREALPSQESSISGALQQSPDPALSVSGRSGPLIAPVPAVSRPSPVSRSLQEGLNPHPHPHPASAPHVMSAPIPPIVECGEDAEYSPYHQPPSGGAYTLQPPHPYEDASSVQPCTEEFIGLVSAVSTGIDDNMPVSVADGTVSHWETMASSATEEDMAARATEETMASRATEEDMAPARRKRPWHQARRRPCCAVDHRRQRRECWWW